MNTEDRETITHNLVQLISQTDIDILLPQLLERGVFTNDMIEKYRDEKMPVGQRKRELYLDLQRRGPNAFRHLLESLLETGHHELVRLLKPSLNIEQYFLQRGTANDEQQLPPRPGLADDFNDLHVRLTMLNHQNPRSVYSLSTTPLTVQVKPATERRDVCCAGELQVYPMRSHPRGYALIINNVEFDHNMEDARVGAEVDGTNLTKLFQDLGFLVDCQSNLGYQDMKNKIIEFAQKQEHIRSDCCVTAIMSHGKAKHTRLDSHIVATDGHLLSAEWVVEQFSSINAPCLARRPKIFFFQMCRGENSDFGMRLQSNDRVQFDGRATVTVPSISDTLIGHSTLPGFKSNRDKFLGTWYIQAICEVFMNHAHDTDIEDMLKIVNQKMELLESEHGTLQTSTYENRGFRKLFFNPGLYENMPGNEAPLR